MWGVGCRVAGALDQGGGIEVFLRWQLPDGQASTLRLHHLQRETSVRFHAQIEKHRSCT